MCGIFAEMALIYCLCCFSSSPALEVTWNTFPRCKGLKLFVLEEQPAVLMMFFKAWSRLHVRGCKEPRVPSLSLKTQR